MSTVDTWLLVLLVAVVTFVAKAVGPAVAGDRALPAPVTRVVVLLASALLSALVVSSALADGERLHLGADTAGVTVAGLLLWRRAPLPLAVVAAALVTAVLRRMGVD
jgi:branched-subunit amino acid transport protein